MSLSDKFYEGLSAPLPVAGAQMPTDLVPYSGGPLDALEQHLHNYKQIDYMNRLSERTSARLLKQLAGAEAGYGEEDMAKTGFVGSNPVSRRTYYLHKLADKSTPGLSLEEADALQSGTPSSEELFSSMPLGSETPPPQNKPTTPPSTLSSSDIAAINSKNRELGLPKLDGSHPIEEVPQAPASTNRPNLPATRGYVGPNSRNLGNSGRTLDDIDRFGRAYREELPPEPVPKKDPPAPVDNRSMYEQFTDGLYHYGTRAARGLSSGAQMGASYLYDKAQENDLLAPKSYMGDALDYMGYRSSLAEQMARINAGLAHGYGRDERDANSKLYADRLRRIDVDPTKPGIQARDDLLSQSKFKEQVLNDQMARYADRDFTPEQRDELRESASRVFDNYYGISGNQAGTPRIGDDLNGTSFRQGIVDIGDAARTAFRRAQDYTGSTDLVAPSKRSVRSQELRNLMARDPSVRAQLERAYGEGAAKQNMSLEDYAAQRIAADFSLDFQENPEVKETPEERAARYTTSRDAVVELMGSMPEIERARFVQSINPQAMQEAMDLSSLVDSDPEQAIARINSMDRTRAKYLLDFIKTVEPLVMGERGLPESRIDSGSFEVPEDRDDLLPSLGGVDIVNPALQEVGGGSSLGDMAGNARRRVFGFNSMHDLPASKGQYHLVDDGYLVNTYYNPITKDVVRLPLTDLGNLAPSVRNGAPGAYSTNTPLPSRYHGDYVKQTGQRPTYTGD